MATTAKIMTTMFEQGTVVTKESTASFAYDSDQRELHLLNLYPEVRYQTMQGFGGAITESVGTILNHLPQEQAQEVINSYFGPDGIGYTVVRTHIDSCDFSMSNYSAVEDPADTALATFSLSHDEENILPYIKKSEQALGGKIAVMLTPWSPPAYMKTNGTKNGGGKLLPEYANRWAEYICRYIEEYRSRGIDVTMLSVQNEPNATQTWDSCTYTGTEERFFLQNHLYPALQAHGLADIEVFVWDHNKERLFDRALECITPVTDKMVSGLAFHWYSGDHFDALRLCREKFPDKKLAFSEGCIEYSRFDKTQQIKNAQMYGHDMIGNLNAGLNLFFDWNILLDENGGPNHVQNYCEAPIMCDTTTNLLEKKLSFYYIAHFSKYIKPGARRIATTCYTSQLETTAFVNLDGTIAVVLLNQTESDLPAYLKLNGQLLEVMCSKESISTVTI